MFAFVGLALLHLMNENSSASIETGQVLEDRGYIPDEGKVSLFTTTSR
jgi:hypothetical protein